MILYNNIYFKYAMCTILSYPGHDQSDVPSKKSEAKTYKKAILSFDEGEEFDTPISALLLPKKTFKHTQQPQQLAVSSSHPATRPTTTTAQATQVVSNNNNNNNNNNNTLYPSSYAVPTQPLTFSMSQISNKLIHSIHNDNKKSFDSSESSSRSSSTDSSSRGKKEKSKKVKKSKNKKEKQS